MKRFLQILLMFICLGLCGICIIQWQREHVLRTRIDELTQLLVQENKKRVEFEEKAARFEQEIARITTLRNQTEAALLDATENVQQLTADQSSRGFSIAILSSAYLQARTEAAALRDLAGQGASAIQQRNEVVAGQNAAIAKANTQLQQLAKDRDEAIRQLNLRTQEFNELVEKYNKLAKQAR